MSYTTELELNAMLPPQFLREALDDDGDGSADTDLLDQVIANASSEVDAFLGARYSVPFTSPFPALVATATRVFVLETLYLRRGYSGEANPWEARAKNLRDRLARMGQGKEPLSPDYEREAPSVSIISGDAKTVDSGGRVSL